MTLRFTTNTHVTLYPARWEPKFYNTYHRSCSMTPYVFQHHHTSCVYNTYHPRSCWVEPYSLQYTSPKILLNGTLRFTTHITPDPAWWDLMFSNTHHPISCWVGPYVLQHTSPQILLSGTLRFTTYITPEPARCDLTFYKTYHPISCSWDLTFYNTHHPPDAARWDLTFNNTHRLTSFWMGP